MIIQTFGNLYVFKGKYYNKTMKKHLLLVVIITLSTSAFCINTDTLKLQRMNTLSQAWGLMAIYTPFTEQEALEYFTILTEEIERIDTSINHERAFNFSIERIYEYSNTKHRINLDSVSNIDSYELMHKDLFKWTSNNLLSPKYQRIFNNIIDKGYIEEDYISPFVNVSSTLAQINDPNYGALLKKYIINDKYDALGVYIYFWNISNYFSPFPVSGKNIDSLFYKYSSEFLSIDSLIIQNYSYLMFQACSDQKDSHLTTAIVYYPSRLSKYMSLSIKDTIATIKEVSPTFAKDYNLIKGDRIISFNNLSVSNRIHTYEKYVRASNQTLTNYRIARKLLIINRKDSVINIEISRNDSLINRSINYNTITAEPIIKDKFPDKFKIINDSVVYINVGKINDNEFTNYLKKSKQYNNIVFDCREYPLKLEFTGKWVNYLLSDNRLYVNYQSIVNSKPGFTFSENYDVTLNSIHKVKPHKVKRFCKNKSFYLISSEQTQSKGESTLLYLKTLTNGNIIGRNTAGVTSTVLNIKLPYSINITMSVKKTFDNNNVLISGAGILPDIPIEEDINDYNKIIEIIKLAKCLKREI